MNATFRRRRVAPADGLVTEALSGFADLNRRPAAGAIRYVLMVGLRELGWLSQTRDGWNAGPLLASFRQREGLGDNVLEFRAGGRP